MNGDRSFAPVQVGEEVDVKVEAVGEKGDGIAKVKGFVLFIPNTAEGDEVKVRVTKVLRKVGFAEVIGASEGGSEEPDQDAPSEESEEPAEEAPAEDAEEPAKAPEPEEVPEDSEDFGEEEKKE